MAAAQPAGAAPADAPWERAVWTCRVPAVRRDVLLTRHPSRPGSGRSGDWGADASSGWRIDFGGEAGARTLPEGLPLPDGWRGLDGHALDNIEHVSAGRHPVNWARALADAPDAGAPAENAALALSRRGRGVRVDLGDGARMGIALRIDYATRPGPGEPDGRVEGCIGIDTDRLLAALREAPIAANATATIGVVPLGDGGAEAGMRVADWIARIRDNTSLDARGAADLGAAQDDHGGRRDAAYVLPADEAGLENDLAGATRDHRVVGMAVVTAVTNARADRGAEALDEMEAARAQVRAALVGWTPPGAFAPVAFRRGRMLRLERDTRWWQDEYETSVISEGGEVG